MVIYNGNNKVAYGLAKKYGIDTTGLTPKEVCDALKEKGISQADSSEKSKEIKDLQSKSSDELKEIATVDISKQSKYIQLPKQEYAQICSAIRTRYANKIPKNSGILIDDFYYQFVYKKNIEQILCVYKIKIEGNEEIINQMEQNKK